MKRPLTGGELALAASVFAGGLDPGPIRLSALKLLPFQHPRIVMAGAGTVWFGRAVPADFAEGSVADRALLLHELTHLAQEQAGMEVWVRGVGAHVGAFLARRSAYDYDRGPGRLAGRPFEHQAAIVEDAYRMLHGVEPRRPGARLDDLLAALGHASRRAASRSASAILGAPPLLRTPLR